MTGNGNPSDGKFPPFINPFLTNQPTTTRPLPRGEVRDMPADAKIHSSAIRRLETNPDYRPGNLILGGGGRGVRKAPKSAGIGEWIWVGEEGDLVGGFYVRKPKLRDEANGGMGEKNGMGIRENGR